MLWVYEIMGKYKSIEYARKNARQLAGAALKEYVVAYGDLPDTPEKRFVGEIVSYMIERDL